MEDETFIRPRAETPVNKQQAKIREALNTLKSAEISLCDTIIRDDQYTYADGDPLILWELCSRKHGTAWEPIHILQVGVWVEIHDGDSVYFVPVVSPMEIIWDAAMKNEQFIKAVLEW